MLYFYDIAHDNLIQKLKKKLPKTTQITHGPNPLSHPNPNSLITLKSLNFQETTHPRQPRRRMQSCCSPATTPSSTSQPHCISRLHLLQSSAPSIDLFSTTVGQLCPPSPCNNSLGPLRLDLWLQGWCLFYFSNGFFLLFSLFYFHTNMAFYYSMYKQKIEFWLLLKSFFCIFLKFFFT